MPADPWTELIIPLASSILIFPLDLFPSCKLSIYNVNYYLNSYLIRSSFYLGFPEFLFVFSVADKISFGINFSFEPIDVFMAKSNSIKLYSCKCDIL